MGKKASRKQLEDALAAARLELAKQHLRGFEAAKLGRRTEGWHASGAGPNTDIRTALAMLIKRHRDLVDNDPWAKRAVEVIQANWIGDGIVGAPAAGSTRRYERMWQAWVESTECDFYGQLNFYGLQELWSRTTAVSGSCLIRRRYAPQLLDRGLPPLQLQVLEPDWLDVTKDDGGRIIGGKQYDDEGRLEGYWLRQQHPGESDWRVMGGLRAQSDFVPREEILHTYELRRPGQYTGIPWGTSVILRLRDMADRDSAQLLKDKLAACFTTFVYDTDPDAADLSGGVLVDALEPGAVEILPPGKDIKFAVPPGSGDYAATQMHHLHAVAMGYGISFESLTGILSQVNFSSARMGWLEFHRNVARWRWNITVSQALNPIHGWFREMAAVMLQVRGPETMIWTPPRREMINPTEEFGALRDAIRSGFMSLSDVQRSLGYVPEQLLDELGSDLEQARARGITLDVDGSRSSRAGVTNARPAGSAFQAE